MAHTCLGPVLGRGEVLEEVLLLAPERTLLEDLKHV